MTFDLGDFFPVVFSQYQIFQLLPRTVCRSVLLEWTAGYKHDSDVEQKQ